MSFQDIACANASGYSAAQYGLPTPEYTVMTSLLASGIASGKQSIQALTGLQTKTLYFLRRRPHPRTPVSKLLYAMKFFSYCKRSRRKAFYLKWKLGSVSYRYDRFENLAEHVYDGLVEQLCDYNPEIIRQLQKKRVSTGVIAVLLGMGWYGYDRYIISGFSFELTHAYGRSAEIDERGTQVSRHASTDIMVLRYLACKFGNLLTTEPVVHESAGVPMLADNSTGP